MWVTLSIFMEGSLIPSFPLTIRGCVWHCICCGKAVSSNLFLWPTGSEWHYTFCERQSHHIFKFHDQLATASRWHCTFCKRHLILWLTGSECQVTLHTLWKAVSSFPMTNSKWVTCERQSHHTFAYDQQQVSDIWKAVSSHLFPWPTACGWHCTSMKGSLTTSFPMTNSKWVTCAKRQSHHLFW